jgi:beta-propeller repeat-containing protein
MKPATRCSMFWLIATFITITACTAHILAADSRPIPDMRKTVAQPKPLSLYLKPRLRFEINQGQTDPRVKFLSRGSGYTLFLTETEAVLELRAGSAAPAPLPLVRRAGERAGLQGESRQTAIRMSLGGANSHARVVGLQPLPGKVNYFIGNDPKKWRTNVPTYGEVKYEDIYPGIDLVYYGDERQLEYDFVVAPGGDPRAIELDLSKPAARGVAPRIDANGDLVIAINGGDLRFRKPIVYQAAGSGSPAAEKDFVDGKFVLKGKRRVAFEIAPYDRTRALVIDPKLDYATYYGGSDYESGRAIAVDAAGSVYFTGHTLSASDFPTHNNEQGSFNGTVEAYVAKLTPDGSYYVYSTYLGGDSDAQDSGVGDGDAAYGIAVDGSGNAYVVGSTICDFPTTDNAYQGSADCDEDSQILQHPFVTKLSAAGDSLLYSTYLGGNGRSYAWAVAADNNGNAYITGGANKDFPTTSNAYDHSCSNCFRNDLPHRAFFAKIDTTLSGDASLKYSTYLGGTGFGSDTGESVAIDSSGNAYITGSAGESDFPVTPDAFQKGSAGMFVAKIDPSQSGSASLVYSTFFPGQYDDFEGFSRIAVLDAADVYIVGVASSGFVAKNALQPVSGGVTDGFVAKLDLTKSGQDGLLWSTFLGGSDRDNASAVALDSAGNVYVAGTTASTDFPVTPNAPQSSLADAEGLYPPGDFFVARIKADGSKLLYSTYLGGASTDYAHAVAVDGSGSAYVLGESNSDNLPLTPGAFQPFTRGQWDLYVAKLKLQPDFSFSPMAAISAEVGGSGSSTATVNSFDDFADSVTLSASLSGFSAVFATNPVTLAADDSAATAMTVDLGPLVTPGTYTLSVTGTSGALTHSTTVSVTVTVTPDSLIQVIQTDISQDCIDNSGVGNAFIVKLNAAKAYIAAGDIQSAINTLTALLNQLYAQAGKHVKTACTDSLIEDVQALLASLGAASIKPNPVMGNTVTSSGLGVAEATVTLIDSAKNAVASATTDATGFFFFAKTSVLTSGATYTLKVSPPKPYKNATSPGFTWSRTMVTANSLVN